MVELVEDTKGKTRDLPISESLRNILIQACDGLDIDRIRVFSGGQCRKGTCGKREGSTRHDLGQAADLELWKDGRALSFTDSGDLPVFEAFVYNCASLGATGIGAGIGYMGKHGVHVGFGKTAVWGKSGSGANAPAWLRDAAKAGWKAGGIETRASYEVTARPGLRLRAGPGLEFGVLSTVGVGEIVSVVGVDGANDDWAQVDLYGDDYVDGYLMRSFLREVDLVDGNVAEAQDNCQADAGPAE